MWKLLLVPLAFYLAILLFLFVFQARLIFPAASVGAIGPLPSANALTLRSADGDLLHGLHLPPARGAADRRVLLVFGGNGWNAAAAAATVRDLYPAHDVVAFHYRGYAPSGGSPSAAALTADSLIVHDEVARRFPGRPIVAIGFSVGSGVACFVAGRRELAGLILVTPFDSLARVAAGQYPWLPVRALFRHDMPAASWLKGRGLPVAILAGRRDALVRPGRTAALRRRVDNLVFDRILDAGHNDIYAAPEFERTMIEALARIGG